MENTAFIHKDLIDVMPVNIHLLKSKTTITALYKGTMLVGLINDFDIINGEPLTDVLKRLIPPNINHIEAYSEEFLNRVEYDNNVNDSRYYFISNKDYYKSKIKPVFYPLTIAKDFCKPMRLLKCNLKIKKND